MRLAALVFMLTLGPFIAAAPNQNSPVLGPRSAPQEKSLPASEQATSNSFLKEARRALDSGDSARALDQANLALRVNPKSARAPLMMGIIKLRQGNAEEAVEILEKAASLAPGVFTTHYTSPLPICK